jgi:hypothetical protein
LLSDRPPLEIAFDVNQNFIMSLSFTVVRRSRPMPENIIGERRSPATSNIKRRGDAFQWGKTLPWRLRDSNKTATVKKNQNHGSRSRREPP